MRFLLSRLENGSDSLVQNIQNYLDLSLVSSRASVTSWGEDASLVSASWLATLVVMVSQ